MDVIHIYVAVFGMSVWPFEGTSGAQKRGM